MALRSAAALAPRLALRLCSGDSYYGPGGLSARQVFDAVQRAKAHDRDAAAREAAAGSSSDPPAGRFSASELNAMSSRELREHLMARSVSCADCFEKHELLERARAHLMRGDG